MSESAPSAGSSLVQQIQAQVGAGLESIEAGQALFDELEGARAELHQQLVGVFMSLERVAGGIGNMAVRVEGLGERAQQATQMVSEGATAISSSMTGSVQTQAQQFPTQTSLFSDRANQVSQGYATVSQRLQFLQSAVIANVNELSEISKLLAVQQAATKRARARSKILRLIARAFRGRL